MKKDKFLDLYTSFLRRYLNIKRPIHVVFDCSNGTTGIILKELFRKSKVKSKKLKVVFVNEKPDGNFPAHGPNPLIKGAMRQLEQGVKNQKADLGVIFDADGDRVFFVDNRGRSIDSNEVGYMLMQMHKSPYVTGIVSSWRLRKLKAIREKRRVFVSRVGHYFFKKLMREKKASLGSEHSGHYYFKDFFYCDSGILAAVKIINFVSGLEPDLASWLDELPQYYRSGEINFKVSDKERVLENIERVYKARADKTLKLDGLTMEFPWGWFNIRPSNTESLLRLNIESVNEEVLKKELQNLKKLIKI